MTINNPKKRGFVPGCAFRKWLFLLGMMMCILLNQGCGVVKYVPEDHYLLNKIDIKSDNKEFGKKELMPYVKQKTNLRVLGMRLHLGLYNISGRDTSKGVNRWFRNIGEAPVVYDEYLTQRSAEEIEKFLGNKGYVYAQVSDTVLFRKKRAHVVYKVKSNQPYKLRQLTYKIEDETLRRLVMTDTISSLLKVGDRFDVDKHDQERERIAKLLNEKGYYGFNKNFIYYIADSALNSFQVEDTLVVENPLVRDSLGKVTRGKHVPYRIRRVAFQTDYNPQKALELKEAYWAELDTLTQGSYFFLSHGLLKIKPEVLINYNFLIPGEIYNYKNAQRSHRLLSSLNMVRYVNIRYVKLPSSNPEEGNLAVIFQLTPAKRQAFSFDVEGTNSSGNLGAAGSFSYQHRNVFGGAEVLNFKIRGGRETQTSTGGRDRFNSTEFGAETSITYPKFLFPFLSEDFKHRFKSSTEVSASYEYQRRPDYTRTIANGGFTYKWRDQKNWSHALGLLDLNYVKVPEMSERFWEQIKNSFLRYSYEDHMVANIHYGLIYNDQEYGKPKDSRYFRFGVETAGNLLYGIHRLFDTEKKNTSYKFLGIKYSQYIKSDVEFVYHQYLNRANSLVYRMALGVGYPYGNTTVMPFEKRYFGGGANGIRAWQVRTLGPGNFRDEAGDIDYMNQSGDIKLEGNFEYRFKLFWILEGALFTDVGNIWTGRNYEEQPGGVFKLNSFYKQLAVGYGFGTRFDVSFFVFRFDVGIKARDPQLPKGEEWLIGTPWSENDRMAFHIAIGYPF